MEQLPDYRIRDAVMIYATQALKLKTLELALITSLVYSPTFLVALTNIRAEMEREDLKLYTLDVLEGVDPQSQEDEETFGDKLVEWVNENLEEYRKPLD